MLKLFCPTLILSSALFFLTTEVTFSQPSSENSPPVVPNSTTDLPLCYIQTEAGTFLDLSGLCGKTPAQNVSTPVGITREEIIASFPKRLQMICNSVAPSRMGPSLKMRCEQLPKTGS